jgi:exodeoxyribonuclease V gamma subunit
VDTAQPLSPLEKDIFLVQSNGVAEWLKISLAENFDISAANRIELPGRFCGRSIVPCSVKQRYPQHHHSIKCP